MLRDGVNVFCLRPFVAVNLILYACIWMDGLWREGEREGGMVEGGRDGGGMDGWMNGGAMDGWWVERWMDGGGMDG